MRFSVALAIFRRMHGEAQQPRTVAPGSERYESDLRDRPSTNGEWSVFAAPGDTRQSVAWSKFGRFAPRVGIAEKTEPTTYARNPEAPTVEAG
jgi:hypothetical protein